jgi:hypothetical protein
MPEGGAPLHTAEIHLNPYEDVIPGNADPGATKGLMNRSKASP